MVLYVDNIKCQSCAKSITDKVDKIIGVTNSSVDVEAGSVTIEGASANKVLILKTLTDMGYPELGSGNIITKAKSFLSCALGVTKE